MPAFQELVNGPLLTELINYELTAIAEDRLYLPEQAAESQMSIFRTEYCGLEIKIVSPEYKPHSLVYSLTEDIVIFAASSMPVYAHRFLQPAPLPYDYFSADRLIYEKPQWRFDVAPQHLRAGYDLFSLEPIKSHTVLIFFSSASRMPIRWEYDRLTCLPLRMVAASLSSSRIQSACRALANMGYVGAAETVAALSEHPDHHVRWSSVVTLLELDFRRGVHALENSLSDAHPHIRMAAKQSLDSLAEAQELA